MAADVGDAVRRTASELGIPVVAAWLYGSRAAGRAHRESDLDVAVLLPFSPPVPERDRFEARVSLTAGLIGALHTDDVDLVVLNDVPPTLARRVVTEGRLVLDTDAQATHAFVRDTLLRAADLEPFLRRTRAAKLRSVRR